MGLEQAGDRRRPRSAARRRRGRARSRSASISGSAARIAPPVPSGSGCSTVSTSSGRPAERSCPGETIAATRPAPASRAARIGQATIGRPQTGCSIFGSRGAHARALARRHDQDQGGNSPRPNRYAGRAAEGLQRSGRLAAAIRTLLRPGGSHARSAAALWAPTVRRRPSARSASLCRQATRSGPAGEDQVDADQEADRPVGASWGTWRGRGCRSAGRRRR